MLSYMSLWRGAERFTRGRGFVRSGVGQFAHPAEPSDVREEAIEAGDQGPATVAPQRPRMLVCQILGLSMESCQPVY